MFMMGAITMLGLSLAITLVAMIVGAVVLTASKIWWFTPLASNWGSLDTLIVITTIICGIVYIVINLIMAYSVNYHRKKEGHKAFFFVDNPRLEWSLIAITAAGIVFLLAPGLYYYAKLITPPQDHMTVEVLAQQWLWSYRYPGKDNTFGASNIKNYTPANPFGIDTKDQASQDDVPSIGEPLHLVLNKPVQLHMRSNDVLHAFYVSEFRVKWDIVPGMITKLWFTPTKVGEFQVYCAELCGVGHYAMNAKVVVMEQADYDKWLAEHATVAQTLKPTATVQR